ncbi:hypothetical protein [Streptococcus parauberis]|uniref:hypothetical protein n=1 Tax=Streptococcus parauberis TaxID=1348 RepID=UPI0010C2D0A7|nr:hypothetical protein [Streptococcus parauberis]QBX27622.1 hypothetical protein Javan400_0024 [Streptococcus phage Javan400]
MNEFRRLHILKHALEHYIERDGASEKDINQEKRVLADVVDDIEIFKERIDSGCGGGC